MLVLVRHGQSESNAAGKLSGRQDPPLTDIGACQAELVGRLLARERAQSQSPRAVRLVASPLRRARATAELIGFALGESQVTVEEALVELDYGRLEGLRPSQVPAETWAAWRADASWRPEGGESLAELHERVSSWCEEIAEEAASTDVVAVSHVSPIKAAAAWAVGAGPELSWRLSLGVAAITRISTSPRLLQSFGETAHLSRESRS